LEELQEVLADNNQQLSALNSKLSELQLMLSNEQDRSSQLSRFIEDERVRFSRVIAETEDRMNGTIRELQFSNDRMIHSESILKQQVLDMKGTVKDKELVILSFRSELAKLSDNDALVTIAMKNMEAHLEELTASLHTKECAFEEQANRNQVLQHDFSELEQKYINSEKETLAVSKEVGILNKKFAIVRDENSTLLFAIEKKQLELLQAEDKISSLQVALTESSKQLKILQRCSVDNVKEIEVMQSLLENANTAANAHMERIGEMNSLVEDMEIKCTASLQEKDRACELKLQELDCRNLDDDREFEIKLRGFEEKNREERERLTRQCNLDRQELESCKHRLCEFETEKATWELQFKSSLASFKDACQQADEVIAAKELRLKELSKLAETQVLFLFTSC
jgi:chromosome segregation ATPase